MLFFSFEDSIKQLILNFMSKDPKSDIFTKLQDQLSKVQEAEEKAVIIFEFLDENGPKTLESEEFAKIIKDNSLHKENPFINALFEDEEEEIDINIDDKTFATFANNLYPDEKESSSRIELFRDLILSKSYGFNKKHRAKVIKDFISGIKDDEAVFGLINELCFENDGKPIFDNIDFLNLVQGRLPSLYASIDELLSQHNIAQVTKPEKIQQLVQKFDAKQQASTPEELQSFFQNFTLSDLFSFYAVISDIEEFKNIITQDFITKISQHFKITDNKAFFNPRELSTALSLMSDEVKYPKFEVLCDYFYQLVPELMEIENYQIKFDEDHVTQEREREGLNKKFKELLQNKNPQDEETIEFFAKILSIENFDEAVNEEEQGNLTTFFKVNKTQLAILFARENGIEDFHKTLSSAGDYCAANMGSQFQLALHANLLQDRPKEDQILYRVTAAMIREILNQGQDVIDIQSNPLLNESVRNHSINPQGMKERVKEDLEPFEITQMMVDLAKGNKDLILLDGNSMKEIIAHAILAKVSEIIQHPSLAKFQEKCDRLQEFRCTSSGSESDTEEALESKTQEEHNPGPGVSKPKHNSLQSNQILRE
jgi:hypothetical protein